MQQAQRTSFFLFIGSEGANLKRYFKFRFGKGKLGYRYSDKNHDVFIFRHISNFVEPFFSNNSALFGKATVHNIFFYPCLKNGNQQLLKENIFKPF